MKNLRIQQLATRSSIKCGPLARVSVPWVPGAQLLSPQPPWSSGLPRGLDPGSNRAAGACPSLGKVKAQEAKRTAQGSRCPIPRGDTSPSRGWGESPSALVGPGDTQGHERKDPKAGEGAWRPRAPQPTPDTAVTGPRGQAGKDGGLTSAG